MNEEKNNLSTDALEQVEETDAAGVAGGTWLPELGIHIPSYPSPPTYSPPVNSEDVPKL